VRGLHLRRHFHVIHDEENPRAASAAAFLDLRRRSELPKPP
jgi:hypothetical protein